MCFVSNVEAAPTLPLQDTVSLLTEGPSKDLYTLWGHIALRVKETRGEDLVFSFGAFDFNTSWFYLKFIQGSLLYTGTVEPFSLFMHSELEEPHFISEQVLHLTQTQASDIKRELLRLNSPEYRYYKYDFLSTNCSTKIRDVLITSLGPGLFSNKIRPTSSTYREELHAYTVEEPWLDFGINLILGAATDKHLSPYERAFLPYNLSSLCGQAILRDNEHLVNHTSVLLKPSLKNTRKGEITPELVFWVILITCVFASFLPGAGAKIDFALFVSSGFLGLLICYLWFISEHIATKNNFNLCWAFPVSIVFPWMKTWFKRVYAIILVFIIAGFLAGFSLWPQSLEPAVLPITLLIFFRLLVVIGKGSFAHLIPLN